MTATASQRGPRVLFGLVGLVLVLALGGYAVQLLVGAGGRDEQPRTGEDPDGPPPGWGRVVLGAPSGAPARPRPAAPESPTPAPPTVDGPRASSSHTAPLDDDGPVAPPAEPPPRYPADLELVVRPGQSLSKIVAQSYGRSTPDLVRRLAAYNGMSDPNLLQAGQSLRVPVKDKLLATTP